MQPTKLTEALIRRLAAEAKPVLVRDITVKGLMVAVNKHTVSFEVQRDLWVGERGRRRKAKTVRRTPGTTNELLPGAVGGVVPGRLVAGVCRC
jgi:hypothetical protein